MVSFGFSAKAKFAKFSSLFYFLQTQFLYAKNRLKNLFYNIFLNYPTHIFFIRLFFYLFSLFCIKKRVTSLIKSFFCNDFLLFKNLLKLGNLLKIPPK